MLEKLAGEQFLVANFPDGPGMCLKRITAIGYRFLLQVVEMIVQFKHHAPDMPGRYT